MAKENGNGRWRVFLEIGIVVVMGFGTFKVMQYQQSEHGKYIQTNYDDIRSLENKTVELRLYHDKDIAGIKETTACIDKKVDRIDLKQEYTIKTLGEIKDKLE